MHLIGQAVDRSKIVREVEEIHSKRRELDWRGGSPEGGKDLEDRVIHRGVHGSGAGVARESHPEVAIHGGGIESSREVVAEGMKSLVIIVASG